MYFGVVLDTTVRLFCLAISISSILLVFFCVVLRDECFKVLPFAGCRFFLASLRPEPTLSFFFSPPPSPPLPGLPSLFFGYVRFFGAPTFDRFFLSPTGLGTTWFPFAADVHGAIRFLCSVCHPPHRLALPSFSSFCPGRLFFFRIRVILPLFFLNLARSGIT